jgi:putative ABC transport system permease protein
MRMSGWRRYVRPLRTDMRADVDDELEFHVEMLTQQLVADGLKHADARAEAERRFGGLNGIRDTCVAIDARRKRRLQLGDLMAMLMQDLRYVFKTLRAAPGFALVVTLTLALGIGATTAIYAVVDTVLVRPLPYESPDRLVEISAVQSHDDRHLPASYPQYLDWKQRSGDVFSDVGTWINSGEVLTGAGDAQQLQVARISANLTTMLGVHMLRGRAFRTDEEALSGNHVVLLSEGVWRSHFGADPAIVGRSITLTGKPWTVIGVIQSDARAILPSSYQFARGKPIDALLPLRLDEKTAPASLHWLNVIGRARSGLSLSQMQRRLDVIAADINKDRATTQGMRVTPLAVALVGDIATPLRLLLAAVAVMLLVACANVANLLLGRAAARRRELALRAALGAGRERILVLILVESLVRALIGGAVGIALAFGLVWAGRVWLATAVPRMTEVAIDARVLALSLAISLASGVLFGVVPALRAARGDLVGGLRDGARGLAGSIGRDRVRRTLIVAEIALSFMLLVTSGLLVRSFMKLVAVPTGFDTSNLETFSTWLPDAGYPDSVAQALAWSRITSQLRQTVGADSVTLASDLPVAPGTDGSVSIEGKTFSDDVMPMAEKRIVGTNYFQVLRATMTAGRPFQAGDILGAPPVVVINESFARRWFPRENPVGKRVGFDWGIAGLQTIVGVVADVKEGPLDHPAAPAIYIPVEQRPNSSMTVVIRTARPESDVAAAARAALRSVDPGLPVNDLHRMSDVIASSVRQRRVIAFVVAAFALNALLLAAIGLYGVISYSVSQRTQEFGIRAALGAQRHDLVRAVFNQSAVFAAAGIAIGIAGSLTTGRVIASQLFGVTQTDPVVFLTVGGILAAVALVATAIPAAQAARIDPLEAIRAE